VPALVYQIFLQATKKKEKNPYMPTKHIKYEYKIHNQNFELFLAK
jgi:hypothetical protein